MNYTADVGWYYSSLNNRAAAWTGVEFLHRFLIKNEGPEPFGEEVPLDTVKAGDIIQLGNRDGFYHRLQCGPPYRRTAFITLSG